MANIQYVDGDDSLLEAVEPLWKKLNKHHQAKSVYFSDFFTDLTFSERIKEFRSDDKLTIHVDLSKDFDTDKVIGYCISSIYEHRFGEINSMFVEEEYRNNGIGDTLIRNALKWIKAHPVKFLQVSVAYGNEDVFGFYERYGFKPRRTVLIQNIEE